MRKSFTYFVLLLLAGCTKSVKEMDDLRPPEQEYASAKGGPPKPSAYKIFTIQPGQHYCDQNTIKSVRTSEMKFMVKFDNSAIYQTVSPENQYDINKLWGFSEGFNNQYHSARVGWSWNESALRLYAYVYASGVRYYQEITPVTIGTEISCSIKVSGSSYIFTVNGSSVTMPRGPASSQASGYQQYPYFGGDETAPHLITIQIKSL